MPGATGLPVLAPEAESNLTPTASVNDRVALAI